MNKMISAMVASLFLILASPAALASPITYTYGFNVTSYDCYLPGCSDENYYRGKLESMTLDLTQQAVTGGKAKLHYTTKDWGGHAPWVTSATNQGFSSVGLGAWNVSLDLDQGICQSDWLCNVEANLDVSDFLMGLFQLDTSNDNVRMNSSGSNTWSGYIYSDGPFMTSWPDNFPTFTGEWRLQRVVPEPGGLVLFLTVLAGIGFFLRRKFC